MGYERANSLAELWSVMETRGSAAQIIAGGQTLLATLAFRLSEPAILVDITGIPELRGISLQGPALRLGPWATWSRPWARIRTPARP